MAESAFMRALWLRLGSIPGLRLWRQNAGQIEGVRLAPTGAADLTGICAGGRRIEIETKAVGCKQTPDQVKWETMIKRHGGVYVLCSEGEGVDACVAKVLKEIQ